MTRTRFLALTLALILCLSLLPVGALAAEEAALDTPDAAVVTDVPEEAPTGDAEAAVPAPEPAEDEIAADEAAASETEAAEEPPAVEEPTDDAEESPAEIEDEAPAEDNAEPVDDAAAEAEPEEVPADDTAEEPDPDGASSWTSGAGTTISTNTSTTGQTYSSTEDFVNALEVKGGTSTITNATVTKSGKGSGDYSDFYGTNAAILVYNGATLNLVGGRVTTNGSYANAIFCYGTGVVNATNVTVTTTSNNSGGVMVTGGGTLTAKNCTVTTSGGSSAPIRSDRGGGTLNVDGGTYTANGRGSPAIYSTANITATGATLISTSAEGVVVEGKNSVTLNNVTLTDTNSTLNGQSTTYKNIFLYQSMSGDASVGTASFSASNSRITTNKGDTLYVTNTTATIYLSGNTIVNNDSTGYFLRAKADSWGKSGSNGGQVTATLSNQSVAGDIYADSVSTIALSLKNGSVLTGAINAANTAKSISLTLDASSKLKLTGDCYVTSLKDDDSSYSNIDLNGHKLYVNGTAITVSSSTSGWTKDATGWMWRDSSGAIVKSKWIQDRGEWYYLKSNGYMAASEWAKDSKGWCWMNASGKITKAKWVQDGGEWYYLKASGYMAAREWAKDSKGWLYLNASGKIAKNAWAKDSHGWLYLGKDGYIVTSAWARDSKGWLYLGKDGYPVTNAWAKDSKGWCYLDASGYMSASTWVDYNGARYYIGADGYMVTGTATIDGKTYTFNDSGALVS